MAFLRIPDRHFKGFSKLNSFTEDEVSSLISAIENEPPGANFKVLSGKIQSLVGLEEDIANIILSLTLSLLSSLEDSELDIEKFKNSIYSSLEEKEKEDLIPTTSLRKYIDLILQKGQNLKVTTKAHTLNSERERILVSSRIITDIRPVFNDEKEEEIQGSIIIHTLQLEFFEDSKKKTMFFAVDSKDLEKLKTDVERAEKKHEKISHHFKSDGIPFFELTE